MRILAHIHPFSAAALIDGTLDALTQTRPPGSILIGTTTLRSTGRTFPEQINPEALARLLELLPLRTMNFALRPRTHGAQIRASLRGIWDGV